MSRVNQIGLGMSAPGSKPPMRGNVLVRAVVVSTYFADEETRESTEGPYTPKSVCCDVLTYGGRYRYFLHRVPVSQLRHGLNDYTSTWIPRPTSVNLSTGESPRYNREGDVVAEDPRDFDGDHVLLQFLENDPMQPVITGTLPHPRANFRQVKSDGEGLRTRFRGVEIGLDPNGNIRIDATKANDGKLINGVEQPADNETHGRLTVLLPRFTTMLVQGSSPNGVVKTFELTLKQGEFEVRLDDGSSLKVTGKDGNAVTVLGDGAMHAVISEHLETLWNALRFWAETELTVATGMGPSGPSTVPAPEWNEAIQSTKLRLPDG